MARKLKIIKIHPSPTKSFNNQRPASDLVISQVRHAQAELVAWVKKHGDVVPNDIKTEQQAADYIRVVTRLLHPEGTPAKKPPFHGIWLGKHTDRPRKRRKQPARGK